jgi:uncharacterized protein GlcG (DUF336 family)
MRSHFSTGLLTVVALLSLSACDRNPGPEVRDASHEAPSMTPPRSRGCEDVPTPADLKRLLQQAPAQNGDAGGLNHGKAMWGAVVDRNGRLCALAASTEDTPATWPGSRGIAIAKASTANAFNSDTSPLSTARLYTLSQPGHSLWGAANGNPINPLCQGAADDTTTGLGKVCGGTIAFGGGLALYKGQTRVGGLGVSGDTSCADHEIAKRARQAAALAPAGLPSDDILFTAVDGPSPFAHPLCPNTFGDGVRIGDEAPAGGPDSVVRRTNSMQ